MDIDGFMNSLVKTVIMILSDNIPQGLCIPFLAKIGFWCSKISLRICNAATYSWTYFDVQIFSF